MNAEEQQVAVAQERSVAVAVIRRLIDIVPYGDFVPIPFNFTIDADGTHFGDMNLRIGYRATSDLDLSGDTGRPIDLRPPIGLGTTPDALQSR